MRRTIIVAATVLLAGCAVLPPDHDAVVDLFGFDPHALDERVRVGPGAQRYAERVAELLPAAVAQVEAAHYLPFAAPVTVYVCGTDACFARHVPAAPRFTAAVIFENRLLLAPRLFEREPERLYGILVHELSHQHLGQRLGHYTMTVPVWFHEGLASLAAAGGGADLVSEEEARRAIVSGRNFLPDAMHDDTYRKNADYWHLGISMFYRQSMLFLAYLRSHDEERFQQLLHRLQSGARFDDAFSAALGASPLDLAQEYFGNLRYGQQGRRAPAAAP